MSVAEICKKFYASYYELNCETQKKLAVFLREIHTHINPITVREQTYSIIITDQEVAQYERIVSILQILCQSIVSTTNEISSTHKLMFRISWKGQFIVPNQFCYSKMEPFVVRLRGKMSEWQTVEIPEIKLNTIHTTESTNSTAWVGRLRYGLKKTLIETNPIKPIVKECDLVRENNELKKRIKLLEDKLLQIFAD